MNDNSRYNKTIWTIGHSTRSIDQFIELLHSSNIELVADIRNFPGSKKYPHFNKNELKTTLRQSDISYIHLKNLGGRRTPKENSKNTSWRNAAFRGYADYMETEEFHEGIAELENISLKQRTACMCSEAVWWRCHRSMVADYLKSRGWKVMHIMNIGKETEHPYTSPAKVSSGKLTYGTGE